MQLWNQRSAFILISLASRGVQGGLDGMKEILNKRGNHILAGALHKLASEAVSEARDIAYTKSLKYFDGTPHVVETPLIKELTRVERAIKASRVSLSAAYLVSGKPGVGKSYAARERGFCYHQLDGEITEGVTAGNVSKYLLDEVDKWIDGDPKLLSKLLAWIDNVRESKSIIVMTTNHPEKLPPELLRAGRISRHVEVTPWGDDLCAEFCRAYGMPMEQAPRRDDAYYVGDLVEWVRQAKLSELMEGLK